MELAITGLINFFMSLAFGIFVLLKNPGSGRKRVFFSGCIAIAFFSFSYFMWQLSANETEALFWIRLLVLGIIIITAGFLHFVFVLVNVIDKKKKEIIIFYIINIIFIALNYFTPLLFSWAELKPSNGYWPVVGHGFYIYGLFWMLECIYALWWLIKGIRRARGIAREQLKFIAIAFIVAFIGGATNILLYYNIIAHPYGNISISISLFIVAYIIIRYRFLDIKIAFTSAGIFLLIYTFVLGIPLMIALYTGFGTVSFMALFVLATIGPLAFRFVQDKANDLFLARQKGYQNFLHDASRVILRERDLTKLTKLIVYMITRAVKIDFAVIFLENRADGSYRLKSSRGRHPFSADCVIPPGSQIVGTITGRQKPFVIGQKNIFAGFTAGEPVQVVVPCLIEERLLGFLLLGEKRDRSFYTPDDLAVFDLLSKETALAVENCYFIEENKRVQERLSQAEKLSIIGGMAEGIAHQIKNRLNYFSLSASGIHMEAENFFEKHGEIAKAHPDVAETFREFDRISRSMVENVQKTDEVIRKVIGYARMEEKENTFSEFSFSGALDTAASLAQIKHDFRESPLRIEIIKPDIIAGIKSRMVECIYNILDNSYEAIEEKIMYRLSADELKDFVPSIFVRLSHTADRSRIEITDNGIGIKEENKKKIFAPYFTTKASFRMKSHSGIGMYVMSRIIEDNHGGKIWFESEYMKGTTFFIELPRNM